jgi:hypothetical protein
MTYLKHFQNMCYSRCRLKYTFALLLNIIYLRFNLPSAKRSFKTGIGKILRQVGRGGCQNSSDQKFDNELNVLVITVTHHYTIHNAARFYSIIVVCKLETCSMNS